MQGIVMLFVVATVACVIQIGAIVVAGVVLK
jgi:hypothetical protein